MVNKVLLIGVQGTGKTWVMKSMINRFRCLRRKKIKTLYFHQSEEYEGKSIIVTGKYDNSTFEGSDKLSMAVMRDYPTFLAYTQPYFVLLEGDRFTNSTVLEKHQRPFVIKIDNDGSEGRELRGTNQSEKALKSMQTRIDNITPDVVVKNSTEALCLIETMAHNYLKSL